MKIKELKKYFVGSISELYPSEEVQSFFNLFSEHYLGMSRIKIVLNSDKILSEATVSKFKKAIQRLKNFEPIQYIIGETEFFGLPFKVDENVLIPRPETEELVSWVIEEREERRDDREEDIRVLDIGTGSGCIAISLASKLPNAKVSALDISKGALGVAKQNAKLNEVNIDFVEADILDSNTWNLKFENLEFDIIVSNPPYVRELEKELMESNVVKHEPATALFVKDEDPLLFYRKIAQFGKEYLKPTGALFFEINEYLAEKMLQLLKEEGYSEIEIKKDIFNKDRMIKCKRI
ncbi:MAG: peptide chain release factor N(5)-glutamine methyltransferase [Flavobacteriaceae bacterium]